MKDLLTILILFFFTFITYSQDFVPVGNYNEKSVQECGLIINSTTIEELSNKEVARLLKDYTSCKGVVNQLPQATKLKYYSNYSELLILDKQYSEAIKVNNYVLEHINTSQEDSLRTLYLQLQIFDFIGDNNQFIETSKLIRSIQKDNNLNDDGFYISSLYAQNKQYDKAIASWFEEKKQFKNIDDDTPFMLMQRNNLGNYYIKNNQLDSAEIVLSKLKQQILASNKWENNTEKDYYIGLVNGSFAQIYKQKGNDEKAIELFKKSIATSKLANNKHNVFEAQLNLINLYIDRNQPELAVNSIHEILKYNNHSLSNTQQLKKHETLAKYYSSTNKHIEANKHLNLLMNIKDKQYLEDNNKMLYSLDLIKNKYELEKRNEKELLHEERRKASKNFNRLVLGIITSLFIGVLIFMLSNNKKNKIVRKNLSKIEAQNQIINKAFKRNSFLLKELNHRVKNNLQVISGILSIEEKVTDNEEIKAITKKTRNRINSIALIHQQFIEQEFEQAVDINSYFETIIQSTVESFGYLNKVDIETTIKVGNMPLDIISPLGLILNELVTNSCKHAFPYADKPKLKLKFIDTQNDYFFSYHDNGPGFKEKNTNSSIGMQLLPGLAKQIDGEIEMKGDNGFLCDIKIRK